MSSTLMKTLTAVSMLTVVTSCTTNTSEEASVAVGRQLYIASGQCNSGTAVTTFSAQNSSRKVSKLDLSTKVLSTVLDFSQAYSGGTFAIDTAPQSIVDNGTSLLVLTENSVALSDRKILTVPKSSPYNTSVYANDALALTPVAAHITRNMVKDSSDGAIILSKSIAIEKIGTNTLRVPQGANPWINAPAGTCGTSVTNISAVAVLPKFTGSSAGKMIFAHQGNTAVLNRLAIVKADGYSVIADCIIGYQTNIAHTFGTGVTGPAGTPAFAATGSSPTAMVFVQTGTAPGVIGKLLVAYSASVVAEVSNNVNVNYGIVSWDVTETTAALATLTNPVVLSRQLDAVFGTSAMAYDTTTNSLYVGTASQVGVMNQTTSSYGYKIEKFTYDSTANTLALVRGSSNEPFMDRSSSSRCISGLAVGSN